MTLRGIAVAALLWLLQSPVFAAVGTVDSFEGDVRVLTATSDLAAHVGMELNEGDTVRTGDNAWALLVMTDGASLTLRQNSQVQLATYRYNPDGNAADNSSVLKLLKGALRSITGYIGRTNRAGYRIDTPTATIGVRGTDHEPAYYPPGAYTDRDPGTYDKVNEGESFIRNPKGQEVSVKPGQYAFVHHNSAIAPRVLQRPPAFYQRHAEQDKRAAVRRQDFHQRFEREYQRRAQERAQRQPARENAKKQQHEAGKQQRQHELQEKRQQRQREMQEKQQRQRELMQKKQQERQAQQQQLKQQREEEQKKRQQERAEKREQKKEHDEEDHHSKHR